MSTPMAETPKRRRARRRFDDDFKAQAVRLVLDEGKGSALMVLSPTPPGTEIQVTASAEVGGLIARVGQRLIEGVAKMTMDRFFSCLAARVVT